MSELLNQIQNALLKKSKNKFINKITQKSESQNINNKSISVRPVLGIKLNEVRKLTKEFYPQIKKLTKKEVFILADQLIQQGTYEHKVVAFQFVHLLSKQFEPSDFKQFKKWILTDILDWYDCDDFCTHALGDFFIKYPKYIPEVLKWSRHKKWQVRRVSAVSLLLLSKRKILRDEVFQVSKNLLNDPHYLVLKGYGWLLKETYPRFPQEVIAFLKKYKSQMPSISFRYAIEKVPVRIRKKF